MGGRRVGGCPHVADVGGIRCQRRHVGEVNYQYRDSERRDSAGLLDKTVVR